MKKTKTPALIEFKGSTVPAIVVTLRSLDPGTLEQAAADMFGDSDFFDGDAGILDLGQLPPDEGSLPGNWAAITACFARHGLKLIGLRGCTPELAATAQAAGLALFPADERRQPPAPEATPPVEAAPVEAPPVEAPPVEAPPVEAPLEAPAPELPPAAPEPAPARTTLVSDRPLRSGQQVYARGGDLVVLAIVNPGAEVIADGSIHIYAPLRGRALAGATGDAQARIFTTRFEAELVSVAGVYRTFEGGVPAELASRPVQVRADAEGNKLLLDSLKLD